MVGECSTGLFLYRLVVPMCQQAASEPPQPAASASSRALCEVWTMRLRVDAVHVDVATALGGVSALTPGAPCLLPSGVSVALDSKPCGG